MEKIKVGVIGTGHLGKLHTKMFAQLQNAALVGVHDTDFAAAKAVAKENHTQAFEQMDELLGKVEAVSIAAVTSEHYQLAKKCLEKNIHVFVEKPITSLLDEAEELVFLSREKNLNLQVGHIERFNPALLALEKYKLNPLFVQSDRLAQFNPRGTDVAVVLDLMIHDIDIILSLVKSEVKSVQASGVAVVSNNIDIANARIEFENGAVANVTASRISQKKMRKMRIFQREGYLSLDFITGVSEVFRLVSSDQKIDEDHINFGEIGVGDKKKFVIYEQPEQVEVNALKYELDLFLQSIIKKEKPVVSGEDGWRALKVADLIVKKIEESLIKLAQ
ncbi:MAG: oxidoreductase [Ignavibacteria bacterium CG22_combo_CG10-13_8_21_14_all_37_15]|nr:MAG: oxidoreductase [Ignavibacteria bacterium CG22_combo_CG10-13_8_21_14_all_37_15]